MSIGDFFNSVFENFKDRVKTPITGAYTISFIIYNWRPIVYLLFSEDTMAFKIEHIDANYHTWDAVVGPLAMALVYIFGVPKSMMWIEKTNKETNDKRKKFKNDDTIADMKHQVEIAESQYKIDQAKNGSREQEEMNAQIKNLQAQNENLTQQLAISSKNTEHANEEINKVLNQMGLLEDRFTKSTQDYVDLSEFIFENKSIKGILNQLSSTEISRFMNYSQQISKNENPTVFMETANKLLDLNLFTEDENGWYYLTAIGEILYKHLGNFERHGEDYNF